MTLILLLVLGSGGAAASAWGLNRGGRAAQGGAIVGGVALLGIVLLTFTLDAPRVGSGPVPEGVGMLDGRLIPNDYLRFVIALWAMDAALVVFITWLAGGLAGLRGLLPAMLAAIVGGTVALASTNLAIGAGAAGATGLVALMVLLAWRDPGTLPAAARELRVTILSTILVVTAIAVAPLAAGFALRASRGDAGTVDEAGAGATIDPVGASAVVGLLVLAVALAAALRTAAIPFHLRVPRIADVASPFSTPLLLAWVPLPLAVVGLAVVDLLLAPLALPPGGEQLLIVAVASVTLVAASIAAFLQDDVRHATGYLVIADGALVLLGFAALTPEAWGPARTWLIVMATSKTALAAWSAVIEDRFGTRRLPDLRGWARRSPLLAAALVLTTLATFGLPGWAAFDARLQLAELAAGPPLGLVLVALGFLTLPAYLRLLGVGTGSPTSRVERAAPERIMRTRRFETLPVEVERSHDEPAAEDAIPADRRSDAHRRRTRRAAQRSRQMASKGATHAGRQLMTALRRDATELSAAAVLAMAMLAALTSWGVLDISGAASEPAPIAVDAATD